VPSVSVFGVTGGLALAAGLYCLLNPSLNTEGIVNLQMLSIGQTLTIVGAVFITARSR